MKNIKILYASVLFLCANSVYAQSNLFAPKKDGISEEELNNIVEDRLLRQKQSMEQSFNDQIQRIDSQQGATLADILLKLEELKNENIVLREAQDQIATDAINRSNSSTVIQPTNSYSEEEVNEELKYLIEEADPAKILVLDEDILRLNKEFGESGLIFRGILDDKKIYKNSSGEFIIKPLDFDAPEDNRDYAETASAN